METEVYVDLYFFINASMDFLCLLIAGRLLHRRMRTARLLLASLLGGGYAVLALLTVAGGVGGFLLDLAAALLLCTVAFGARREGFCRLLVAGGAFALISMVMGGVMTALYSLLNRLDLPFELLDTDTVSVWVFGLLALAAGLLTAKGGRWMGVSEGVRWVTVRARLFGGEVEMRAMVDTGNLLTDPISGRGVIVAERQCLLHVLPKPLCGEGMSEREVLDFIRRTPDVAARVRLIPTSTATGGGLMTAFVPDSLTVSEGGRTYEADYLIGIASLGERAQSFDALMPRV